MQNKKSTNMNPVTITPPEGFEIDKEKSTFEKIFFKPVENKYPKSIYGVGGRYCHLLIDGSIFYDEAYSKYKTGVSSTSRAKAVLALIQLVELRDAWNKVDGFVVDWHNPANTKFVIISGIVGPMAGDTRYEKRVLYFGHQDTRDKFFEQFRDLIEDAKEFL